MGESWSLLVALSISNQAMSKADLQQLVKRQHKKALIRLTGSINPPTELEHDKSGKLLSALLC